MTPGSVDVTLTVIEIWIAIMLTTTTMSITMLRLCFPFLGNMSSGILADTDTSHKLPFVALCRTSLDHSCLLSCHSLNKRCQNFADEQILRVHGPCHASIPSSKVTDDSMNHKYTAAIKCLNTELIALLTAFHRIPRYQSFVLR